MSMRTKTTTAVAVPEKKITPDDIQSKLRELQGEVSEEVETARTFGLAAGVGAIVIAIILAYFFGRRRGKKRQTVLEIRRI
jgi:hypothetical protein